MEQGKYVPLIRLMMIKERNIPYMEEHVNTPEKIVKLVRKILFGADREYLLVLSADIQLKPVAIEILSIGTANMTLAHAREVFKHAILVNASYIIIIHNHPSGKCTPSLADIRTTENLAKAGEFMGIPIADHVIVGDEYFSFRKEEMLPEYEGDFRYIVC